MSNFQIDASAIVVAGMTGTIVEMIGMSFMLSLLVSIVVLGCMLYFLAEQPKVTVPPLRRKHKRYVGWFE